LTNFTDWESSQLQLATGSSPSLGPICNFANFANFTNWESSQLQLATGSCATGFRV